MLSRSDLRKVQLDMARFVNEGEESVAYVEMGIGKTAAWLAALDERFEEDPNLRALVVAPRAVALTVWPEQARQWDFFRRWKVRTAASGSRAERYKTLVSRARLVTINVDMVAWLAEQFKNQRLPFDLVIFDEVDKFKSPGSLRYKKTLPLVDRFRTRFGGTGTLISENLSEIYAPMNLVTQGRAFPQSFDRWKRRYFYQKGPGGPGGVGAKWLPQRGAEEAIMKRVGPLVFRARAADHLDLPPVIHLEHRVQMEGPLKKIYQDLERTHRVELRSGNKVTAIATANTQMKLRQVLSGFLYTEPDVDPGDGRDFDPTRLRRCTQWLTKSGGPKFEALRDLLSSLGGEQALILTQFIAEREKLSLPWLSGSLASAELIQRVRDWNLGKIRAMVGHPRSMGHGLNLQEGGAHHLVWLSLPWSRSEYDQAIGRLQRRGQKNTVFNHVIVVERSVDEVVANALKEKLDIRQALEAYFLAS